MSNYKRYFNNSTNPVFITIVTYKRRKILIPNIEILRGSFKYEKNKISFDIIAISIQQYHCHVILSAENSLEIPKIIRTIKFNFSVNIPEEYIHSDISQSAKQRGEKGIWQRRYYDHIIRNEQDLFKHIDYIHYNSFKHYHISPKNWEYSSFNKFVKNGYYDKNWCNVNDRYNISDIDYE